MRIQIHYPDGLNRYAETILQKEELAHVTKDGNVFKGYYKNFKTLLDKDPKKAIFQIQDSREYTFTGLVSYWYVQSVEIKGPFIYFTCEEKHGDLNG